MKSIRLLTSLLVAAALGSAVLAAEKEKTPPAKDNYPLKTCVVSGEALGSMGDYISYVHKEAGKPDREIRFCCKDCVDDFKANPAKFLKKLDEASAAKKSEGDTTAHAAAGHGEHKH